VPAHDVTVDPGRLTAILASRLAAIVNRPGFVGGYDALASGMIIV
jgi:hypothetical protein